MEGSDCVYGGYYRAVTPQFGQEKKAGGGDHFTVENLLDFSNEEVYDSGNNGGDDGVSEAGTGNSTDFSAVTTVESCNSSFSGGDQYFSGGRSVIDASLSGDLCEPLQYDELAELEWLSNFVEDSFSSEDLQKLQLISGVKSGPRSLLGVVSNSSSDTRGSEVPSSAGKLTDQQPVPFLPEAIAVPGKPRSKRSRAAPCNWSSRLLALSPIAATSSSDSILLNPNPLKKTLKPAKKEEPGSGGLALMAATEGRKCLHCATEKTPQWRTGPMGPKTLCNACGVRYKSGRLVPEYRPAASPTFVLSKHSNSHRKVLELRRQKEMQQDNQQQFVHQGPKVYDGGAAGHADEFLIHRRFGPDFRQLI